jgi:MFS transporter, putative metabolite:H+ symporter
VRLVARISAGGWFEFYDLFMTAYIALGLTGSGLYTALGTGINSIAGFAGCGFAGMFVGTLLFGWVSDHFGRKATFVWSLVAYSLLTAAMALARTAIAIDTLRFLAGIGIGVQIVTIDAYISELAPKDVRGSLIALSQTICYSAVPVVAFIAALAVPHSFAGLEGWRWVALVGALGAIAVWPIQVGLPESGRWLQRASRSLMDIFVPPYRKRTVMLSIFNVVQTIGFYGFASWIAILLQQGGHGVAASLQYTAAIAIVTPLGPLLAIRLAAWSASFKSCCLDWQLRCLRCLLVV